MYCRLTKPPYKQKNIDAATNSEIAPLLTFTPYSFGEFFCDGDYLTTRTQLPQFLLLYTLEGQGFLRYHGKKYSLLPHTAMIIDCYEWQEYGTDGTFWHFYYSHFGGKCAKYLYENLTNDEQFVFTIQNPITFEVTFNEIFTFPSITSPRDFLLCNTILSELFTQLSDEKDFERQSDKQRAQILQAKSYIEKNCEQPISLDALAAQFYLSKYYFLRCFRAETGYTPGAYLRACRVNRAQKLLRTTDLSVEEIAEQTGYSDVSAFTRAFRSSTNLTPGQFRNI